MMNDQAALQTDLLTIRDYIRWTTSQLNRHQVYFGHGTDNAWDEATQLVLGAVYLPWNADPMVLDARLAQEEKARVLDFVSARIDERKPLPYLTNEAWFCELPFYVDERVLIPRSPIGQLIQTEFSPWLRDGPVPRVLDLCTGSGCIGIACAYAFPEAMVDLVDLSPDAIEVSWTNIEKHEMNDRVRALESDLFSAVSNERYDLIVSNPPYVDAGDLASMPDEYQHEPELALGSGPDGLDITRRILREANDYLTDDGLLIVEVGNSEIHMMEQYPHLPITWLELPEGGNGVFAITAQDLATCRHQI